MFRNNIKTILEKDHDWKIPKEMTIEKLEKDYGVSFDVMEKILLSTWLKRNGLPAASKVLKKLEKYGNKKK